MLIIVQPFEVKLKFLVSGTSITKASNVETHLIPVLRKIQGLTSSKVTPEVPK